MSAAEGQKVAAMTIKTLIFVQTDKILLAFWENVQRAANKFEALGESIVAPKAKLQDAMIKDVFSQRQVEDHYHPMTELLVGLK